MATFDVRAFVRHFRENGLKVLFEDAGNVRDLVALTGRTFLGDLDFARMEIDRTSYVAADYRHLASDFVVKVPYRTRLGGRRRRLTLYILLEHQSEPDALMTFRALEYLIQIYKGQIRAWKKKHKGSLEGFAFDPVLPIVLYTGTTRWETLTPMVDLVLAGTEFADLIPEFRPLLLSLPALTTEILGTRGGYLGGVLELIREREARPEEYRALVARVLVHLEGLARTEADRWLLLLSYIQALAYHDREPAEREEVRRLIATSALRAEKPEVRNMAKSIADALIEEGMEKGAVRTSQDILIRLLREKFGRVPRSVVKVIRATDNEEQLHAWLTQLIRANTLDDLSIGASEET